MLDGLPLTRLPRLLRDDKSTEQPPLLLDTSLSSEECRLRNDRQSYLHIVRQLVKAQFVLQDRELTIRLWQEVAERHMDLGRIVNLLYGCNFHDVESMLVADEKYLALLVPDEAARS
tara:strand:- start:211 stop:561 length:351 start_codon:yes stop_codon:yes gene_type:complete